MCPRIVYEILFLFWQLQNISTGPGFEVCSTDEFNKMDVDIQGFWWENLREGDHWENLGVDGRIILKRILEKWDGGTHRIYLAQDRGTWRTLVNAVMNLLVQ